MVAPDVVRSCASCQSFTQDDPEQIESLVAGQYQKLRFDVPVGTVMVCLIVLSPAASAAGGTVPSKAEELPLWALVFVVVGGEVPAATHGASPFSNPPLMTTG